MNNDKKKDIFMIFYSLFCCRQLNRAYLCESGALSWLTLVTHSEHRGLFQINDTTNLIFKQKCLDVYIKEQLCNTSSVHLMRKCLDIWVPNDDHNCVCFL